MQAVNTSALPPEPLTNPHDFELVDPLLPECWDYTMCTTLWSCASNPGLLTCKAGAIYAELHTPSSFYVPFEPVALEALAGVLLTAVLL